MRYSWLIILYWFQVYRIVIQYFYRYTPHKPLIKCWLYVYIISLYLIYFIPSSWCLLICFPYLAPWHLSTLITTSLFSVSVHLFVLLYIKNVLFFRFNMWEKTYSTCLYLTYFAKHNTLQVCLCCCKWQNFILFCGSVIFHHICICICVCVCILLLFSH